MGLKTNSGGGGSTVFLSAINVGEEDVFWARRVSKDTEGAVEREAKCGLVYELYYPAVSGIIEAVRIVDKGQMGEELEIRLKDDDPDSELTFLLQTNFSGDLGKHFIVRMENLIADVPVEIGVFRKHEGTRDKRFLYMNQDGDKVTHDYTKDGAKSLPDPIESEGRRGKKEWDWTEHDNALFDICEDLAVKMGWAEDKVEFALSTFKHEKKADAPADEPPVPATSPVDDEDDVPF